MTIYFILFDVLIHYIPHSKNFFQLLKWNFDQPTAEHVEQLKNLLSSIAQPALFLLLFHKDFKQHLKAIDLLHSVNF